jgi:acyl-CoA synthetase (AMP-forming)/AMP-acid ligase II
MIATLLSGGVLLPLDADLPMQRKQRMLMEAKAKRLLYVGPMEPDDAWLEETVAVAGLFVDPQKGCVIESETQKDQQQHELPAIDPDDPAYIFFTSGSTGVPKGILVCNRSGRSSSSINGAFFRCSASRYFPALDERCHPLLASRG